MASDAFDRQQRQLEIGVYGGTGHERGRRHVKTAHWQDYGTRT